MLRATYLFLIGVILTMATLAFGQETSVENALRVSRKTGKPIFAIASRKVCGPCQLLKSRVANVFKNKTVADQVVYLKVDLDDESWNTWSRKFPHQGRMLPIVYLIRADERQMYGQSNTLPGDQLQKFIDQGVAHCGQSLDDSEIQQLEKANQSIEAAIDANEMEVAVEWVKSISNLGSPGQLNCFAAAAIRNNELSVKVAEKSTEYVQQKLVDIEQNLAGNANEKFQAVYRFVAMEKTFGKFENLADHFSKVAVKLAVNKELRQLWSLSRSVHDANETLSSKQSHKAKSQALASLTEIENSDAPQIAKLAAAEVKRRNEAVVASVIKQSQAK